MDISTTIAGFKLETCIMNASGCWCRTKEELDDLNLSKCSAIVSKSSTLNPRVGNPEPKLYLEALGSINSMGLPNLGYKFYLDYGQQITNKPFIQSLYPFSIDEFELMLKELDVIKTPRLVEVNLSCPNLMGKKSTTFEIYEQYMNAANQCDLKHIKIGYKLPPFFEQHEFEQMSYLCLKYKPNFITCVNSLPNGLSINWQHETTNIHPKQGLGGIGGTYLKPIGLANVYRFSKLLDSSVDIIGCGGVETGKDIFEYILCGAKAVQVGTHLVRHGPKIFETLAGELEDIMKLKSYNTVNDFLGQVKVVDSIL